MENSEKVNSVPNIQVEKEKMQDNLSTESILSSINEECNKVILKFQENGLNSDEDLNVLDSIDLNCKNENKKQINCIDSSNTTITNKKQNSVLSTIDENCENKGQNSSKAVISNNISRTNSPLSDNELNIKISEVHSGNDYKQNGLSESEDEIDTTVDAPILKSRLDNTTNDNNVKSNMSKSKLVKSSENILDNESKTLDCKEKLDDLEEIIHDMDLKQEYSNDLKTDKTGNNVDCNVSENKNSINSDVVSDDSNISTSHKIKLRSFASLCEGESDHNSLQSDAENKKTTEYSNFSIGDIVEHNNYVESDKSGVMHLKISNVVGGEDCITGLNIENSDPVDQLQLTSVTSLVEPFSEEAVNAKDFSSDGVLEKFQANNTLNTYINSNREANETAVDSTMTLNNEELHIGLESSCLKPEDYIVNIFRSPLVVHKICDFCKFRKLCEYRVSKRKQGATVTKFLCSAVCKKRYTTVLPTDHVLTSPRLNFERVCGMCGKEITKESIKENEGVIAWQTREFCNKLCLADHIGEVARTCFHCNSNVRVIYMVKYCVRFGSDVHQFCCNNCLEQYKCSVKVCSFCQKNLTTSTSTITSSHDKLYCAVKCMKRAQGKDIGQPKYDVRSACTVCNKTGINQFIFLFENQFSKSVVFKLCSALCLSTFKYVKKVKSVNCCFCSRLLDVEAASNYFFIGLQLKVFCSESCSSVFVISSRKIVTCNYCKVKKYNYDMIYSANANGLSHFYSCSYCCLNLTSSNVKEIVEPPASNSQTLLLKDSPSPKPISNQIPEASITVLPYKKTLHVSTSVSPSPIPNLHQLETTSAQLSPLTQTSPAPANTLAPTQVAPIVKNCNMCGKLETTQFHMVMSDSTLRSFCSYTCASRYKNNFGYQVSMPQINDNHITGPASPPVLPSPIPKPASAEVPIKPAEKSKRSTAMQAANNATQAAFRNVFDGLMPPTVSNIGVMCHPKTSSKGVSCVPETNDISVQTDDPGRVLVPVPVPVYVPTPMMMYTANTPVPFPIPIPLPIPIFIPTDQKTSQDLSEKIKDILENHPLKRLEEYENHVEPSTDKENADSSMEVEEITEQTEETGSKSRSEKKDSGEATHPGEIELLIQIQKTLTIFDLREAESEETSEPKLKRFRNTELIDTELGVSVWCSWVQRKIAVCDNVEAASMYRGDVYNISSKQLCQLLAEFVSDLEKYRRKVDVDTIYYVLLCLQCYLFENDSKFCILLETNFDLFTSAFDYLIRSHFNWATVPDSGRLYLTRINEEMMWQSKQLGANTPHALINTLFYYNTKEFKLKTPMEHYNLSFDKILRKIKNTSYGSATCLEYTTKDSGKDLAVKYEMVENQRNPLRCPVKLYEFYLSKCPPMLRKEKDVYYVYPERTCVPESGTWYSSDTFELRNIERIFNRILLVKEIQESLFGNS